MCFFSSLPLNKITELSVDNFEVKHLYTDESKNLQMGKIPFQKYTTESCTTEKKNIFQFAAK